jgi:hypothetical protein
MYMELQESGCGPSGQDGFSTDVQGFATDCSWQRGGGRGGWRGCGLGGGLGGGLGQDDPLACSEQSLSDGLPVASTVGA